MKQEKNHLKNNQMTKEKILEKIAITTGYDTWVGLMDDSHYLSQIEYIFNAMDMYNKQVCINLINELKDYTREGHVILGHDERSTEDFYEIFKNK